VKKQKTARKDAQLLLRLMRENSFPQIWVPGPENRDLRQLLWHRHRLVQMRTRIMNQLQALAMNEGYRWKKKLFSEQGRAQLEKLTLAPGPVDAGKSCWSCWTGSIHGGAVLRARSCKRRIQPRKAHRTPGSPLLGEMSG
jgi:transposase